MTATACPLLCMVMYAEDTCQSALSKEEQQSAETITFVCTFLSNAYKS